MRRANGIRRKRVNAGGHGRDDSLLRAYDQMKPAHEAIHNWAREKGYKLA
jgi:hypothetical protein